VEERREEGRGEKLKNRSVYVAVVLPVSVFIPR